MAPAGSSAGLHQPDSPDSGYAPAVRGGEPSPAAEDGSTGRHVGLWLGAAGLLVVLGVAGWLAWTGMTAVGELRVAQSAVEKTRQAAADLNTSAAVQAAAEAEAAANTAADLVHDPIWSAVAALPWLGDSAETVQDVTEALALAAHASEPLVEVAELLQPSAVWDGGQVRLERLAKAAQPLAQATDDLQQARQVLEQMPSADGGGLVLGRVATAADDVAGAVTDVADRVSDTSEIVGLLPEMLGSDAPQRWFVGLVSPSEARGIGGFPGTWLLVEADSGRLTVTDTGSNSDFSGLLSTMPVDDPVYVTRYGQDPRRIGNTTISPHFPYTGTLWSAFWDEMMPGPPIDGAISLDVVSMGYLQQGIGPITLPDGQVLTPEQAVSFAVTGVYDRFPNRVERDRVQEELAATMVSGVLSGNVPVRDLFAAAARSIQERRLLAWSADDDQQTVLERLAVGGVLDIDRDAGTTAFPVVINAGASKLDTFLHRDISYDVEECVDAASAPGRLTMELSSNIPAGVTVPPYVYGQAPVGPAGAKSRTQVQVHLGPDSVITDVLVDGKQRAFFPFRERERNAAMVEVTLVQDRPKVIEFRTREPAAGAPPTLTQQPLVQPAVMSSRHVACGSLG